MFSVSRSSVLFFTTGMGVACVALLGASHDTAIAQIPGTPDGGQFGVKTMSQVNVLFVNPSVGDDSAGNGGEQRTPLKTITQALRLARPNTVIMLSQGTYTVETGEIFPLMLKPSVSIHGDQGSKGRDIIIRGGGDYLSRSFGGQNVTIIGANQAELTGVTVTNSNPRGYGLWIENSNPVIVENTFSGSTQDGIAVTSNSAPIIRKNFLYGNGANGLTISGNSRAQVLENVFQQTGFGINIAQNAQPVVIGNLIQDNRTGIVVQANARPILQSNLIQGNKEDGLVAIAQAIPDLGSASQPGKNEFRNNARYDINASAAKQLIPAYGNTLAMNRIIGKVDTDITNPINQNSQLATVSKNTAQNIPIGGEVIFSNSIQETTNRQRAPFPNDNSNSGARQLNSQLLPLQPANAPVSVAAVNQKQPRNKTKVFPTPSSLAGSGSQGTATPRTTQMPADTPQMNYVQINANTIEFTAPQSPVRDYSNAPVPHSPPANPVASAPVQRARSQRQSLPTLEAAPVGDSALLPVPDPNIPIGNTGNIRKVPVPQTPTKTAYAREAQIDLRYRVVVEIETEKEQQLVRFLAPGSFRTVWRGRGVMQAGVYSTRYNADNMVKILNNNGLRAVIEPIN